MHTDVNHYSGEMLWQIHAELSEHQKARDKMMLTSFWRDRQLKEGE